MIRDLVKAALPESVWHSQYRIYNITPLNPGFYLLTTTGDHISIENASSLVMVQTVPDYIYLIFTPDGVPLVIHSQGRPDYFIDVSNKANRVRVEQELIDMGHPVYE